ncbi:hypothetical protein [Deinococcus misasensis]|nr:hypothetical protein [Deinococcus misasensis]
MDLFKKCKRIQIWNAESQMPVHPVWSTGPVGFSGKRLPLDPPDGLG